MWIIRFFEVAGCQLSRRGSPTITTGSRSFNINFRPAHSSRPAPTNFALQGRRLLDHLADFVLARSRRDPVEIEEEHHGGLSIAKF